VEPTVSTEHEAEVDQPEVESSRPAVTLTGDPAATATPKEDTRPVEQILVEQGLLTQKQIDRALRIQSRLEEQKPLAALVVDLGWVSRAAIEGALKLHRRHLPIEEILFEKGLVDAYQLDSAREHARAQPGQSVAQCLVEMQLVSEREYLQACCERYDLPFVEADINLVDKRLLKKVSLQYLARHRVLPLTVDDGQLTVLVDRPDQPELTHELQRLFRTPVSLALATRAGIDEALASLAGDLPDAGPGPQGAIRYHKIVEDVDSKQVTGIVDSLFLKAIRQGASDIHFEPMASKLRIRFRIDGSLVHVSDYPAAYIGPIISRLKVLAQADVAQHRVHQDGRIYVRDGNEEIDCRASFYVTVFGENCVIRVLRKEQALLGLEALGFPSPVLRTYIDDVVETTTGIVLVCGPTGSGKTTTLYSTVERLNDNSRKIITCEDPVEYVIQGITQCSVQHRPGIDFVDSLKAIVRQDPDIILIGEIRDRASADMAIQSALTGHKVLSTFHTEDSVGAIARLLDMGIEAFLLASTINAIMSQRLVRRQCQECRIPYTPSPREMRALALTHGEIEGIELTRGKGCERCMHTGYKGRTGLYELLVLTDALRDAIIERRPSHELRRMAAEAPSFVHLQEDGVLKVIQGETTFAEVLDNTPRIKAVRPIRELMEIYG
jgi:type IV pilus assembly protein PilB